MHKVCEIPTKVEGGERIAWFKAHLASFYCTCMYNEEIRANVEIKQKSCDCERSRDKAEVGRVMFSPTIHQPTL